MADLVPTQLFIHWGNKNVSMGPSDIKELGKRPSLMVTRGNTSHKIASFSSLEAAREFEAIMDEFMVWTQEVTW